MTLCVSLSIRRAQAMTLRNLNLEQGVHRRESREGSIGASQAAVRLVMLLSLCYAGERDGEGYGEREEH